MCWATSKPTGQEGLSTEGRVCPGVGSCKTESILRILRKGFAFVGRIERT